MGCDLRPTLSLSFFLSNSPAFLLRYNGDDSHGFNGVHGVFCTYQVGAFLMLVVEGSLDLGWMSWVSCGSQDCCSHPVTLQNECQNGAARQSSNCYRV